MVAYQVVGTTLPQNALLAYSWGAWCVNSEVDNMALLTKPFNL